MSYINLLFAAVLLLSACASQDQVPDKQTNHASQNTEIKASFDDIAKYREAISLLSNGEIDKAKSVLTEFTVDHPQLAGPWANLGLIAIKENKLDTAETLLNKSLERNPKLAQAYNLLAYIEKYRGNILKAKDLYKQAIKHKPDYAMAHYNLALVYDIYIQDINRAITHYQKYMTLIKKKDQKTADWLDHLKLSVKKG